jgi:Brp/Blh family beta-carotene 15,15'-monooxygenase
MINRFFTDSYLYLYFSVATIFINFLFKDYINDKNIVVMLLFFVIFFGLPHGALDTLYAKKSNLYYNFISFITFNIVYLLVGVITFFLWLLFPLLCLFIFLLISILHFSEDWRTEISFLQRIILATSIITLTVFFHREEVEIIFFSLTRSTYIADLSLFFYYANYLLLPMLLTVLLYNIRNDKIVLNIITITLTAFFLNPLIYFLCYFCFFHSVKNFKESKNFLFPDNKQLQNKVILLNLLLTIFLSIIIFKFFLIGSIEDRLLKIIFIGLASLTVPHMLLKAFINHKN